MNSKGWFSKLTFRAQPFLILALLLVVRPGIASAGESGAAPGLTVASPTVPPGGLLQMQVFMTEPKPILKGRQRVRSQAATSAATNSAAAVADVVSPLGAVRDAAIFSAGGDVSGVAVTDSEGTQFFFSSPLTTYGTSTDIPVITLAYPVRATARAGQSMNLTLDADDSQWLNPMGKPYSFELKSGVMTVGGTLSITDVVPGAGVVPAGTVISINGLGFQPDSKVDFGEAHVTTMRYVNPKLIEVTLRSAAEIRGQRIRINNRNNEQAVYFPYQHTARAGKSAHSLVAESYPLFASTAQTLGYFRLTFQGTLFSGIALQNLNATSVKATLRLSSSDGLLLAKRTLTLATNTYVARDLVELFPGALPENGTKLSVTSDQKIQMLGLLGDDTGGTVLPVAPSSTP
jgi:hypothetical protein